MRYVQARLTRYLGAMALAVGLAVTASVPAGLAMTNQYGNVVLPLAHGGSGPACYVDGALQSCDGPVPVTLYPPSQLGTVAGGEDLGVPDIDGAGNH
jgi:hypothetical protein